MCRRFCAAAVMALALISPAYSAKPHQDKHKPVAVPENWRVSDTLILSAAALLVLGTLARLKVLRLDVS